MARWLALLCGLAGLPQDDGVAREALKGWSHPWAGFRPGSRLVFNETRKESSFDAEQKKTVFKDRVTQHVWTVKGTGEDRVILHMEGGGQQADVPIYLAMPGMFRGKGESRGEAEVSAGGKRYRCAVTAIVLDPDKDAGQVTTIYRCPGAPAWAVKVVAETFMGGKRNTWEEEVLVEEDRKLVIDQQEVLCHVVEVTSGSEGGGRTVKREWRSDAVPGRVVLRETRYFTGDREIEGAAVKMEVVSFEARR